jgi:glycosyltransferase involved in cell wall biosynthesis
VNIVHTESVKALGGQSLRLISEARQLEELGHPCTIVAPEGSAFHREAPRDVRFVPFRFQARKIKATPVDVIRARSLLRRLRPDVVHTHSSRDAWTFGMAARVLGIPIVRGRHVLRSIPRGPGRMVYSQLADAFTVSGPAVGRTLIESGVAQPADVFITGGCVDLERFDGARVERDFLRRELGLPNGARLIGTACNLRSMKGVDVLLAAFDELAGSGPEDLHLVHAGNGRSSFFAAHLAHHPRRIHVLGFRNDVERVIGGLDAFVLASRSHEGLSQVLCQAMVLGVPVVATDAGGNADLVVPGATGILVRPEDPAELAAGIRRALELEPAERAALLARARQLVLEEYSLGTVVGRYLRAYEHVLGASHGHAARRVPEQGRPSARGSLASPSR